MFKSESNQRKFLSNQTLKKFTSREREREGSQRLIFKRELGIESLNKGRRKRKIQTQTCTVRKRKREDLELKWKKKRKDHKFIQSRFF